MHGTMYPDGWNNCIDRTEAEKEIRPKRKRAERLKRGECREIIHQLRRKHSGAGG